jgi:hypothetical protein
MSRRRLPVVFALILTLLLPVAALAQTSGPTTPAYALATPLSGGNEIPPGDADGFGYARVTIFPETSELCYSLSVARIGTPTAAHIHEGAAGATGRVIVPLAAPVPDGLVRGCVSVDRTLLNAIMAAPSNYYVNVHNAEFPDGALRGQLQSDGLSTPSPMGPNPENAVLDWNLHAANVFINAPGAPIQGVGQVPTVASLHLAMVQGAVYDAVNMIEGGYLPYNEGLPEAPETASKSAAVATAAHHVIVGVVLMTPLSEEIITRLDALLAESIAAAIEVDGQTAVTDGIAAGEAAAATMLAARANDGRFGTFAFTPGTEPGDWRPEPPTNIGDPFGWVAQVQPFLVESPSQFRTAGPLDLTSDQYATEYNEVKALGGPTGTSSRTAEQEAMAQFYAVNALELYTRAFRTIALTEGLTMAEQARLFAMMDMAIADALITCWDDKAYWSFWRPITAIQHGDEDGNPNTIGDPTWMPMLGTPPYPEHPSGYNSASGAVVNAAIAFFGTNDMEFSLVKIGTNETRDFTHFTDMTAETIEVRIYHGLHFRTAEVQAVEIGKNVVDWLVAHYFQPVP